MKYLLLTATVVLGVSLLGIAFLLGQTMNDASDETRARAAQLPNVVFIVLDTLRFDRVGAQRNGEPIMPFLSELAEESAWFSNAMSPSSWTKPAMTSVLTSTNVHTHEVIYAARLEDDGVITSDTLPPDLQPMASWLLAHGYDNMAYQTNANLMEELGFARGFAPERYTFNNGAPAEWVTGLALQELPQLDTPFHLYLHYMDPHAPYNPPDEYLDIFGPLPEISAEETEILAPEHFMEYFFDRVNVYLDLVETYSIAELSPEAKAYIEHLYDVEVRYMDDMLQALITSIRHQYPDTIFVITSDHGEEFWERGGMGHGYTLYEEQIHVPLLIHGPGIEAREYDQRVSLIGILPTLADLLDLPRHPQWEGENLFTAAGDRPKFAMTMGPSANMPTFVEAVIDQDYKLICDRLRDFDGLFYLPEDPDEEQDLREEIDDLRRHMHDKLAAHSLEEHFEEVAIRTAPAADLDPDRAEALRTLGYE